MRPGYQPNEQTRTPLQLLIDNAMNEIRSLDCGAGNNAGEEMIDLMVRFFERPPPPKDFPNMEDFLLYRHEDAAVPLVHTIYPSMKRSDHLAGMSSAAQSSP